MFNASHSSYVQLKLSAMSRWRLMDLPGFDGLLKEISIGSSINADDLLPYLCRESGQDRLWVNYCLADAYHRAGNNEYAMVFIRRVWNFSGQNEKFLPLLVMIHAAVGDIESIRAAHKALGMKKAGADKVSAALAHFNSWQYAYAVHNKSDEYCYDFEVLDCISQLAGKYAFPVRKPTSWAKRKIRLALCNGSRMGGGQPASLFGFCRFADSHNHIPRLEQEFQKNGVERGGSCHFDSPHFLYAGHFERLEDWRG